MDISLLITHLSKRIILTENDKSFIQSELNTEFLKKGEFLLEQGDVCKKTSFVIEGCVKTYHTDKNGSEHVVAFAIEDWWTGDLASFTTNAPSDYSVKCLEDTTVVHFSKKNYEALHAQIPLFEKFLTDLYSSAYVNAQKRLVNNFSLTAKESYIEFRKKYPQFEQRIPQYLIASYLGITKEFLSKIRKEISLES